MDPGSSFADSPAAATPTTGARRYTFLRRLAVGGMGELLLARAAAPGGVQKLVAIKRVRSEYASDEAFVTMFLNEARLAATLDHPNVVRTYDLVEDDGNFFMVMEYLHGESLGQILNTVVSAGAQVPVEHIITIALGVASGLHCAHERRGVDGRPLDIVHRDLSPGNVFVTFEGGVKLLDFGIAKATSRTTITVGPTRKGKVAYMSPEQCVGGDIDRRSDIFSLGIVLWELSTGRRLFRGDNEFAIMNQITTTDAPPPLEHAPQLPPQLAEVLGRALQRDPEDRYPTAMAFRDALEAVAHTHGIMPSDAALGRYLEATCGFREFPSAEPTAEFEHAEAATLVVPAASPRARPRHLGIVLALLGGVSIGAVAVAASSSDPAPAAEPIAPQVAEAEPEPSAPPAPPPTEAAPEPSPPPEPPQADAEAPTPVEPVVAAPEPPRPDKRTRPVKKKRRKKAKSDPPPKKPDRGVDGILPGD
ncbi:MAG: serine/threonine-protein kinase [Myxococcota bacterium]